MDAVAHTASPFYVADVATTEELIDPAVKGTRGVLESVHKHNPDVKRVVITSSVAAIMNLDVKPPVTYAVELSALMSDSLRRTGTLTLPTRSRRKARMQEVPPSIKLPRPTLKRQAGVSDPLAWLTPEFLEDNKPSFDIATINPPFVLGPVIHQVDKVESLNTSVATFHAWAAGKKTEDDLPGGMGNWVDVRDSGSIVNAADRSRRGSRQGSDCRRGRRRALHCWRGRLHRPGHC